MTAQPLNSSLSNGIGLHHQPVNQPSASIKPHAHAWEWLLRRLTGLAWHGHRRPARLHGSPCVIAEVWGDMPCCQVMLASAATLGARSSCMYEQLLDREGSSMSTAQILGSSTGLEKGHY